MSPSSAAAITLDHVSIRRAGRTVIDDISLAIAAGTIHVLIGPNGAGKSTLLSAVLGQTAFSGSIELGLRGSRRIAYVPQAFVADRTLPITIAEFLALSRQRWPVCFGVTRTARAQCDAILERVGLAGMARRRLGELSGGELRRVLIGNALAPAPELLLCDEPAAGLDADSVLQLDELLIELRDKSHTTVLMVSHDRSEVHRIADQVTLLDVRARHTGTAAEVLSDESAPMLAGARS